MKSNTKKPSSVGKRYPGQQHNFGKQVAHRNDSKVYAENVTYLSEFTGKEPDAITVLFCIGDHIATKTHVKTEDGVTTLGFSAGKFFTSQTIPVEQYLPNFRKSWKMIEKIKVALLIRGLPLPHVKPLFRILARRSRPGATYLSPADGHHHFELDIDKIALARGDVAYSGQRARSHRLCGVNSAGGVSQRLVPLPAFIQCRNP